MFSYPYPLKFQAIFKEKIWGGPKLASQLNKHIDPKLPIGESWEISDMLDSQTKVKNGVHKGKTIKELTDTWGEAFLGRSNNGNNKKFPMLIKFIDATDYLSIQVHPDERIAENFHDETKTEMWYVLDADPGAKLICGFNQKMNKELYLKHLKEDTLEDILNWYSVKPGDVFFLPPGRIHAIGKGILLAEIQEASDTTYRIYDWNRKDTQGRGRELHTEKAIEAIDFEHTKNSLISYNKTDNGLISLVKAKTFHTNLLCLKKHFPFVKKEYQSFVILIVCEGDGTLCWGDNQHESLAQGETVLIPASIENIKITPKTPMKILETHTPLHA